jgi:hypothetical protein
MFTRLAARAAAGAVAVAAALGVAMPAAHAVRPTYTLSDNYNGYAVHNGPQYYPLVQIANPGGGQIVFINELVTYHWNNGAGAPGGTLKLETLSGNVVATGYAFGTSTDWQAYVSPPVSVAPGNYMLVDSDPSTWSANSQSQNAGFARVFGYYAQTNPTPAPAPWQPCNSSSNAWVTMSPCSGRAGTQVVTMRLEQNVSYPIASVAWFVQSYNGSWCIGSAASGPGCAPSVSGAVTGGGTSPYNRYQYSRYQTVPPAGLCTYGTHRNWLLIPIDSTGRGMGGAGYFNIGC